MPQSYRNLNYKKSCNLDPQSFFYIYNNPDAITIQSVFKMLAFDLNVIYLTL